MNAKKNKVTSFFQQIKDSHQQFLILGLGVTGRAWVERLSQENIQHTVMASLDDASHDFLKTLTNTEIILSPGIPRSHPFVQQAEQLNIKVWNEVDFLYPLFKHFTTIAITGTDGKTSTLVFTQHLLTHGFPHRPVIAAGNNGTPVISVVDEFNQEDGLLILEFSSYMLEKLYQFRANYNIVLNVAPDHLDRYQDFNHYACCKYQLLTHTTANDHFIVNCEHQITARYLKEHLPNKEINQIFIGRHNQPTSNHLHYSYDDQFFYISPSTTTINKIKNPNSIQEIPSTYPINILTALTFSHRLGMDHSEIAQHLTTFQPIAHRLEKVNIPSSSRLIVINDSKATTLQATIQAIETFTFPIHLILGGQNKNISFNLLKKYRDKIKQFYFYGQAGEEIRQVILGDTSTPKNIKENGMRIQNTFYHYSLDEVITTALIDLSQALNFSSDTITHQEVLLFSPACSSFDQFKNFEERGSFFKQRVITFFNS